MIEKLVLSHKTELGNIAGGTMIKKTPEPNDSVGISGDYIIVAAVGVYLVTILEKTINQVARWRVLCCADRLYERLSAIVTRLLR